MRINIKYPPHNTKHQLYLLKKINKFVAGQQTEQSGVSAQQQRQPTDPQLRQILSRFHASTSADERTRLFTNLKKTPHLLAAFLKMNKTPNDVNIFDYFLIFPFLKNSAVIDISFLFDYFCGIYICVCSVFNRLSDWKNFKKSNFCLYLNWSPSNQILIKYIA